MFELVLWSTEVLYIYTLKTTTQHEIYINNNHPYNLVPLYRTRCGMHNYVDRITIKINNKILGKLFYKRHHRNKIHPKYMENE